MVDKFPNFRQNLSALARGWQHPAIPWGREILPKLFYHNLTLCAECFIRKKNKVNIWHKIQLPVYTWHFSKQVEIIHSPYNMSPQCVRTTTKALSTIL